MIVPAIGIVVENDQRRVRPLRLALQEVGYPDHERLLINWIGIPRMSVLNGDGFEETHRREIARRNSGKEIFNVIVVIGRVARETNRLCGPWPGMGRIRSRSIILERSVMRNIVALSSNNLRGGLTVAASAAVRIHRFQVETSSEPAPSNIGSVEQVADILPAHLYQA